MSKQVKQIMCQEMTSRFRGVDACLVVDPTQLDGIMGNRLRRHLAAGKVEMLLVKNSLVKRALVGLPLEPVGQLLQGPCALAYGGDSIVDLAKLVVASVKEMPKLVIKGAVFEGRPLDSAAAAALSKLPTKAELRSTLAGMVLSPGRQLAGAVQGAGAMLANLLKGRIEALEKKEGAPAAA